jgi:hypothetical protein
MNKKLKPQKKSVPPALTLRLQIKRGCLMIHLSVKARWLAAAVVALLAASLGSGALAQWVQVLVR